MPIEQPEPLKLPSKPDLHSFLNDDYKRNFPQAHLALQTINRWLSKLTPESQIAHAISTDPHIAITQRHAMGHTAKYAEQAVASIRLPQVVYAQGDRALGTLQEQMGQFALQVADQQSKPAEILLGQARTIANALHQSLDYFISEGLVENCPPPPNGNPVGRGGK